MALVNYLPDTSIRPTRYIHHDLALTHLKNYPNKHTMLESYIIAFCYLTHNNQVQNHLIHVATLKVSNPFFMKQISTFITFISKGGKDQEQ